MSKFLNTTNRTVAWFKRVSDNGELEMKPPFQRNPVWTLPQKSYLIDSILNGYPVPEIYMQDFVNESGEEHHVVIDGQQRIRACLEFVEGAFSLTEADSLNWGGMSFEELESDDKKRIFSYIFIVRTLPDMPDENIRAIFQRLNKNVVALNSQELRQATYWGPFITAMQEIANYPYWNTTGIFTPLNIRRMMDVEFFSEVSVAILHGHQNKKETLDSFYERYEEEFEERDSLLSTFQVVILELEKLLPDIKNTRWRKKSDFYTLFVLLADHAISLPLSAERRYALRQRLDAFAAAVNVYLGSGEGTIPELEEMYARSIRASSDIGNRRRRHEALSEALLPALTGSAHIAPVVIEPETSDLFGGTTGEPEEPQDPHEQQES
jgi:hypothetical protein